MAGRGLLARGKQLLRSFSGGDDDGHDHEGGGSVPPPSAAGGEARLARTGPARVGGGGGKASLTAAAAYVSVSATARCSTERRRGRQEQQEQQRPRGGGEEDEEREGGDDDNPFAGPFKVTVTTPGSGRGSTGSGRGSIPEMLRSASIGSSSSYGSNNDDAAASSGAGAAAGADYDEGYGEGEGEEEDDEDEEEEEEDKPFDPRKAHEAFIRQALQGGGAIGGAAALASPSTAAAAAAAAEAMSQSLRKRLKWADEDGGELKNVQYFDKEAEPSQVLRMMLAADARAEGAPGTGRAAMGREEIVTNLAPYLAQIKGNIQEVLPIKLMRNGETRTVLIAGRGPIRTRVGVAIVWMGGLIKHLKIMRNPEPEFLEDQPVDPASPDMPPRPGGGTDDQHAPDFATPRSTEAELLELSPPYLVPRPDVFPTPTLLVQVISAHNLKSSATLPRPVNPYVKLRLGKVELRTNVLTNTKNPVWGGEDATHSRFRFRADDPNAMLRVTVGDWKIGKNVWIARLALPLASIEVTSDPKSDGVLKEYDLRLRVSRFGKHIEKEGASNARLVLKLKYEHMERSWTMKELKARDEARMREEEAEAAAEEAAYHARKEGRTDPGALAAAAAAAACSLM